VLNQKEMEEIIRQAKKEMTMEQIKEVVYKSSYGGTPVNMIMDLKGGDIRYGKTNA